MLFGVHTRTVSFVAWLSFLGGIVSAIPDVDATAPFRPAIPAFDDLVSSNGTDALFYGEGNLLILMQTKSRERASCATGGTGSQQPNIYCPVGTSCCPKGSGCCPSGYNCQQASNGEYGYCPVGQICQNVISRSCAE